MQIGILQCDDVRSSLSAEFGEYPEMIAAALGWIDESFTFITYKVHEGELPESPSECDAFIITGSRYSVFDPDILWINSLLNFVVQLNKLRIKTIGICFGHQLIAEAMEGRVERDDCGWQIGIHKATIKQSRPFMVPKQQIFHITMLCEDQIQELPETAAVLASSPDCQYMMLQYGEHMLSLQGHPEFSADFTRALLHLRQEEFPEKRLSRGLNALNGKRLDNELLFNWIANFIRQSMIDMCSDTVPE